MTDNEITLKLHHSLLQFMAIHGMTDATIIYKTAETRGVITAHADKEKPDPTIITVAKGVSRVLSVIKNQ